MGNWALLELLDAALLGHLGSGTRIMLSAGSVRPGLLLRFAPDCEAAAPRRPPQAWTPGRRSVLRLRPVSEARDPRSASRRAQNTMGWSIGEAASELGVDPETWEVGSVAG